MFKYFIYLNGYNNSDYRPTCHLQDKKGVTAATLWPALMAIPSVLDVERKERGRTHVLKLQLRNVSSVCY